jgi:hypothetical protein
MFDCRHSRQTPVRENAISEQKGLINAKTQLECCATLQMTRLERFGAKTRRFADSLFVGPKRFVFSEKRFAGSSKRSSGWTLAVRSFWESALCSWT